MGGLFFDFEPFRIPRRSSILADEMGLGKTVQTVSLVRMAKERYGAQGPALVVAPLSTLAHWQREFEHWSALDVMVYHGSQASRLEARNLDLMARKTAAKKNPKIKTPKTPSVDVVVTTYEQLLLEDSANALGAISWSLLVVDEAHRLKNPHSRLYRTLHGDNGTFKAISRLLLTGTPLQNNMTELWSLLSFCDDKRFGDDPDEFVEKYAFVSCVGIPWLLFLLVSGPVGPRRIDSVVIPWLLAGRRRCVTSTVSLRLRRVDGVAAMASRRWRRVGGVSPRTRLASDVTQTPSPRYRGETRTNAGPAPTRPRPKGWPSRRRTTIKRTTAPSFLRCWMKCAPTFYEGSRPTSKSPCRRRRRSWSPSR